MSRQPRKVFGFTGATKYGPLAADPPKGDSAPKAAGAPKAADMNRNSTGSGDKEDSCWSDFTEAFKDCFCPDNRRGV